MSEWEPATDAEVAMRDALRTDDQESYFRILSGVDLLLPVSADALAGLAPLGWGTWSTGGRTHVLAFTSTAALQACLADYTGSARRVPYGELANTWPNLEWWLAVNPGLPIEGYLPAWFVAQLSRGDLRLPTRGPGREKSPPARLQDLHSAAMAANEAAAHKEEAAATGGPVPQGQAPAGYPQQPAAAAAFGQPGGAAPTGFPHSVTSAPAGYPQPSSGAPAGYPHPVTGVPANYAQPDYPQPGSGAPAGYPQPGSGVPAGYPQPGSGVPAGYPEPGSGVPAGYPQPGSPAAAGYPRPGSAPPASRPYPASASQAGYPQPSSAPPAGSPHPSSGAPAAYGPPSSAPSSGFPAPSSGFPAASSGFPEASSGFPAASSGFPRPSSAPPAGYPRPSSAPPAAAPLAQPTGGAPASYARAAAAAGQPPGLPPLDAEQPAESKPEVGPGGLPIRSPGTVLPSGLPSRTPTAAAAPQAAAPAAPAVPSAYRPPGVPGAPAAGWPGSRPGEAPHASMQDPSGRLPVRTPMANTPPIPEHLAPPDPFEAPVDPRWAGARGAAAGPAPTDLPRRAPAPATEEAGRGSFPQGPASPQAAAQRPGLAEQRPGLAEQRPGLAEQRPGLAEQRPGLAEQRPGLAEQRPGLAEQRPGLAEQRPGLADQPAPGVGSPLPRRQAASAAEQAPMTSFPAFKTPAERAVTSSAPARPGSVPPVIPGSPGSDRPARLGATPPLEVRGAAPVPAPASHPLPAPASHPLPAGPPHEVFVPANEVERDLHDAADGGSTDQFLSTLLLATVLVPVAPHSRPGSAPGESGFAFRTEEIDGERFLIVFTSKDRLAEHFAEPTRTVSVRFYELIRNWPDPSWSFAVNPGTPVGAKYPGPQVIALANWATEAGLGADPAEHPAEEQHPPVPAPQPASDDAQHATVMQKTLPPEQVDYYLERGYDRVAGFVHRATEVEHLRTPAELFGALGLTYEGSPHQADAKEAYVLRWPAYRPSLYRIPYGGQNEQALRAMDGWVIERAPFRGNGFAPGEGRDVIAEFKVDSVRLPHGAQLWRVDADGAEHMVAIFDNDGPLWRRVGEQ